MYIILKNKWKLVLLLECFCIRKVVAKDAENLRPQRDLNQ